MCFINFIEKPYVIYAIAFQPFHSAYQSTTHHMFVQDLIPSGACANTNASVKLCSVDAAADANVGADAVLC